MKQEHQNIKNTVTSYLVRVHHISNSSPIIKQFIQEMETRLIYRARKELKLVKSIESKLRKGKYILRFTDKSGIFHLGHASDYEQKAEAYRQKTGAYIELESDQLWPIFDKVVHLLNSLRSKDHIRAWQHNEMMPKKNKVALAYLYFIPKPHKVTNVYTLSYNVTIYVVYFHRKALH